MQSSAYAVLFKLQQYSLTSLVQGGGCHEIKGTDAIVADAACWAEPHGVGGPPRGGCCAGTLRHTT